MSIVTRFSAFFLAALACVLGGFSVSVYYLVESRLYQTVDAQIRSGLDRFQPGPRPSRVLWAVLDDKGKTLDGGPTEDHAPPLPIDALKALTAETPYSTASIVTGKRIRLVVRKIGDTRDRRGPGTGGPRLGPPPMPGPEAFAKSKAADDGARNTPAGDGQGRGFGGGPQGGRRLRPIIRRGPIFIAAWTSIEPLLADLRSLVIGLSVISMSLWALAAAIGRHFGKRALAPLSDLADAARHMPWSSGQRLPNPNTGDELEDFAKSFNGLLDRLDLALERQKQFTGQASHQLRTPLAGLIAAIEVARRRTRSAQDYEHVLDTLHEDAIRLWKVVEALLFLARADAEAPLPDLKRIEVHEWVRDQLQRWSGHERFRDLVISEEPGASAWVLAHGQLLGQLLDNLIENACKYSKSGEPIRVAITSEGDHASITVEDHGIGIAKAEQEQVFSPFFRGEQALKQGKGGVGLGLAVARRIAAVHGGELDLESEPGEGSRFTLILPTAAAEPKPDYVAV